MDNLWAAGPTVFREGKWKNIQYDHDNPVLHRVGIERIGGMGEPNAGEFLANTPCGYTGWVRQINKNPERLMTCEACLNGKASQWVRSMVFPLTRTEDPQSDSPDDLEA
jgi:hypothetical protein